jgi:hypothetical protein
MAAAHWIKKGLSASKAIGKVRKSRPGAIEMPEQEESLFQLEAELSTAGWARDFLRLANAFSA